MNVNPRKLLGLPVQSIEQGMQANFLLLDTEAEYAFNPSTLKSKQQNTPFGGKQLKGKVHGVFASGKWFPC
jgi:dihydroorotase